jgi:hypothetical protein
MQLHLGLANQGTYECNHCGLDALSFQIKQSGRGQRKIRISNCCILIRAAEINNLSWAVTALLKRGR